MALLYILCTVLYTNINYVFINAVLLYYNTCNYVIHIIYTMLILNCIRKPVY